MLFVEWIIISKERSTPDFYDKGIVIQKIQTLFFSQKIVWVQNGRFILVDMLIFRAIPIFQICITKIKNQSTQTSILATFLTIYMYILLFSLKLIISLNDGLGLFQISLSCGSNGINDQEILLQIFLRILKYRRNNDFFL